jgi:hypothetical protein
VTLAVVAPANVKNRRRETCISLTLINVVCKYRSHHTRLRLSASKNWLKFWLFKYCEATRVAKYPKVYNLCMRFNATQHKQTVPHHTGQETTCGKKLHVARNYMWQETTRIAVTNADTKLLCDDHCAIGLLLKNTVVS